jgi:hypothetical protein
MMVWKVLEKSSPRPSKGDKMKEFLMKKREICSRSLMGRTSLPYAFQNQKKLNL